MAGKPVGVGIIGLGTVGSGVVKLLGDMPVSMQRRKNAVFSIERIAVREKSKDRIVSIDEQILTEDVAELLDDPKIDMIVELTVHQLTEMVVLLSLITILQVLVLGTLVIQV